MIFLLEKVIAKSDHLKKMYNRSFLNDVFMMFLTKADYYFPPSDPFINVLGLCRNLLDIVPTLPFVSHFVWNA